MSLWRPRAPSAEDSAQRAGPATGVHDGESWFGSLGQKDDPVAEDPITQALDASGWRDSLDRSDDGRFLFRQLRRVANADDNAQQRVLFTYVGARTVLGVALLATQVLQGLLTGKPFSWIAAICLAYAFQALSCQLWPGFRTVHAGRITLRQWWSTVGVDVAVFGALHVLDAAGTLNFAALLVLPVLLSGVLCAWLPALATAAAATLILLGAALHRVLLGGELTGPLLQAGLAGLGLFVVTLLAGQMASWLAREERTARGGLELAYQQAELNRLVIDEMTEGVLVVDHAGRVRVANPAARALLAEGQSCPPAPFSLHDQPGWRPLLLAVERALQASHWPSLGQEITVAFAQEVPRLIQVRARCTRSTGLRPLAPDESSQEVLAVLFIEAASTVQARQRQEQLMAMGRISASIAHEIRNPLAAVAQANALLSEDKLRPDQSALVRIIGDNVDRLKRITDDVMDAAPGGSANTPSIDLAAELRTIHQEWAQTCGLDLGPDSRLRLLLPVGPLGAAFDPDHLRRVLVNLLDNALRHCRQMPGSMVLTLEGLDDTRLRLTVASDGPLIEPQVERHLFEPFYSTRSRGAGLGLYICRELCQRHGAILDYHRRPGHRHGNVFVVVLRRDQLHVELPL